MGIFDDIVGWGAGALSSVWDTAKGAVGGAVKAATGVVGSVVGAVKDVAVRVVDVGKDALHMAGSAAGTLYGDLKTVPQWAGDRIAQAEGIAGNIAGGLTSPFTMVALGVGALVVLQMSRK